MLGRARLVTRSLEKRYNACRNYAFEDLGH